MATADDYAGWIVKNADKKGTPEFETVAKAYQLAKSESSAPEKPPEVRPEESGWETIRNGLATAPINAYLGVKQFAGGLDPIEQNILAQNRESEKKAPVTAVASNILTAIPAAMIPGANTAAGAGVISAVQGLLQPVDGEQSLGNIAQGKGINTAVGGALGAAGQWAGNKIASALGARLADKTAKASAAQSRNSLKDTALAEGRAAGYKVPNSEVAPTFIGNRLESIGGKAAIKQEATIGNQQVTNSLARKSLGIPDDVAISQGVLDNLRKTAGKTYQEVASLSDNAAADLEALKTARNEAQGWFNAYNRSARPDDLVKAKEARALSDSLEAALEKHAEDAGKVSLIPALRDARKQIAKTYTVERALNKATGDVEAPIIGRLFDKGKPLSDGLETVGKFNQAFPKFTGPATSTPAAGVSKSEALAGLLLGGGTAAATGNPYGLVAGALPLLSHPARSMALSKALEKTPEYGVDALTKMGAKIPPETLQVLIRSLLAGSPPAGYLAAQ